MLRKIRQCTETRTYVSDNMNETNKHTLLSTLGNSNYSLLENASNIFTYTLLFGNASLTPSDNSKILKATINFISSTKRFDEQLF